MWIAHRASRNASSLVEDSYDASFSAFKFLGRATPVFLYSSRSDSSGSSLRSSAAHQHAQAVVPASSTSSTTDERISASYYEQKLFAHARNHEWSRALHELAEMQAHGIFPSDRCGSAVLAALNRSGRWWLALQVFETLAGSSFGKRIVVGPGVSCYNAAIGACARGSKWENAIALLNLLQQRRTATAFGPDAVSYSTAIDACARKVKWAVAIVLLVETVAVNLEPTITALGAALAAQEKASQWARALSLLDWGRLRRMSLSAVAYNSCISACGSGGEWDRSLTMLARMRNDMLAPSIISYNAVIRACAIESQHQLAIDVCNALVDQKLKPTSTTYTALITAHGSSSSWQEAVAQLQSADAVRDKVCWTSAISACAQNRKWAAALALLRDLPSSGARPDAIAFNATIAAFMDTDSWEWTLALLSDMRARAVEPDHATFTTVVAVASRASAASVAHGCYWQADHLHVLGDGQLQQIVATVIDFHDLTVDVARVALDCTVLDRAAWPRYQREAVIRRGSRNLIFVADSGTRPLRLQENVERLLAHPLHRTSGAEEGVEEDAERIRLVCERLAWRFE